MYFADAWHETLLAGRGDSMSGVNHLLYYVSQRRGRFSWQYKDPVGCALCVVPELQTLTGHVSYSHHF